MGWKQAVTLLIIIFSVAAVQALFADTLIQIQDGLLGTGNYQNPHWDGNALISDMVSSWFNMGLVAMFLVAGAAIARVVRKELTRQQRRP